MQNKLLSLKVLNSALIMGALFFISSCGKMSIDKSAHAHKVGYPTIEIVCDNEISNGLAICLNPSKIQVQTYYQGELTIDSERCGIHNRIEFADSQVVDIIPQYTDTSCNIDLTMTVIYDEKTRIISKGFIYLKKSIHEVITKSAKIPEGGREFIEFKADKKSRVVIDGCGVRIDQEFEPQNGSIKIWSDLLGHSLPQCVYEAVIDPKENPLRYSTFFVYYKTKDEQGNSFIPLSIPSISFEKDKIKIVAEESVGIISFNGKTVVKNTATFDRSNGIIRLITTSGRTAIGIVQDEQIIWKR